MAVTPTTFFRGAATVTLTTTLATIAATSAIITNIVVTNTAAAAGTFDIAIDGVKVAAGVAIAANAVVAIDLKQPIAATKLITGGASAVTINFHISGVQLS